jgi:hypothetical protein
MVMTKIDPMMMPVRLREQQPLNRHVDQSCSNQALVDQAIAAQQRNPGDHADDIAGPKRDRTQHKQQGLNAAGPHIKRQKIRHGETNHQSDQPDQKTELECGQVGLERHTHVRGVAAPVKDGQVVFGGEVWQQLILIEVPETDHADQSQGHQKKHHKHQRERQGLPPRRQTPACDQCR